MNGSKTKDVICVCLGGVMILLILFSILTLDRKGGLHCSRGLRTQNPAPVSSEQFWQHLPG